MISLIAMLLLEAAAPIKSELPSFEFRSIRVGDPMPAKGNAFCIRPRYLEGVICKEPDFEVAGVSAVKAGKIYVDKRLTGFLFSVDRQDGPTLAAALKAKYGPPCDRKTTEVQNNFGAKLPRETLSWCFREGQIHLDSVGSELRFSDFEFTVDTSPKAPLVDF